MKIEVIDTSRGKRFLWVDEQYDAPLEHIAASLVAPYYCCGEEIEIYRKYLPPINRSLLATGYVNWVGAHGAGPLFQFSIWNPNAFGNSISVLSAKRLEVGDEIIIQPAVGRKSQTGFEKAYWLCMLGLKEGDGLFYEPRTKKVSA